MLLHKNFMQKLTIPELLEMKKLLEAKLKEYERQIEMYKISIEIIEKYIKMKEAEERERRK